MWGQSYLGLTRSISWLLMSSSHDIDYIEYVVPSFTSGTNLSTCVISMWRNDTKCKYMIMFPLKHLARKGLSMVLTLTFVSSYHYYVFYVNICCWVTHIFILLSKKFGIITNHKFNDCLLNLYPVCIYWNSGGYEQTQNLLHSLVSGNIQ